MLLHVIHIFSINILKIVRYHVLIQSDSPDDLDIGTTYDIVRGRVMRQIMLKLAEQKLH